MLGWSDLKEIIALSDDTVECPVKGCQHTVPRQRIDFRADAQFQCPVHRIFISPSTFEYENERENMLWTADDDLALWTCIKAKGVKRESRIARDNSEDAVTWNIFRYLEKQGLIGEFLNLVAGERIAKNPRLVYWSFCQVSRKPWQPLLDSATTFGESIARRSEPDLIVDDDDVLAFVENKVRADNRTPGKDKKPKLYATGGGGWWGQAFASASDFNRVAVDGRFYELMRFWLLGSWTAHQAGKRFLLVNVVRGDDNNESDIEARFGAHIQAGPQRRLVRATWEQVYKGIVQPRAGCPDADRLARYFQEKTIGYRPINRDSQARLSRAFNVPRPS